VRFGANLQVVFGWLRRVQLRLQRLLRAAAVMRAAAVAVLAGVRFVLRLRLQGSCIASACSRVAQQQRRSVCKHAEGSPLFDLCRSVAARASAVVGVAPVRCAPPLRATP